MKMKARLFALAAVLVAVCLWIAHSRGLGVDLAEALPGDAPLAADLPQQAGPRLLSNDPVRAKAASPRGEAAADDEENGEVTSSGARGTRADRLAAAEAQDAQARVNRQRLFSSTLADLSAAADQADREGKPQYAAALRRRAEILSQSMESQSMELK